jgi:hypothetical protein
VPQKGKKGWVWWNMLLTPPIQEAEIGRISARQKVSKTLCQPTAGLGGMPVILVMQDA